MLHLLWFGVLPFTFYLYLTTGPSWWPPVWMERNAQRKTVLERVNSSGGWEELGKACQALIEKNPNGLFWSRFDTNSAPLPTAIADLKPRQVQYYPPRVMNESGEDSQHVVRIKVFGAHSTGSRSMLYYSLWVLCSTNFGDYYPDLRHKGGTMEGGIRKITDHIFEIY